MDGYEFGVLWYEKVTNCGYFCLHKLVTSILHLTCLDSTAIHYYDAGLASDQIYADSYVAGGLWMILQTWLATDSRKHRNSSPIYLCGYHLWKEDPDNLY